jgi:hypothetical protein
MNHGDAGVAKNRWLVERDHRPAGPEAVIKPV